MQFSKDGNGCQYKTGPHHIDPDLRIARHKIRHRALKGTGMTDQQANTQIANIAQSQLGVTNTFTSNNYEDNAATVNSIFNIDPFDYVQ